MSRQYAILRTEKIKDWSAVSGSGNHNLRLGNYGNNVDESRSHLNRYIIKPKDDDLNKHIRERFEECGVQPKWYGNKHKNNSVIAIEVFMGVSNGFFDDKKPEVLDEWIELNTQYLKDKFGEKNIASLSLHYDETTPHLQAHITPIVEYKDKNKETKYKLSAKDMIGGHKSRHHLEQTNYAKRFKQLGLERGQEHSKDRNMRPSEFNRIVNILNKELDKMRYVKVEKPPFLVTSHKKYQENLQEKVDFLNDQAKAYKLKAMIAEGKVNGKTFREFEEKVKERDEKIKEKDKKIKQLRGLIKKRDKKIEDLLSKNGDLREDTENLFSQRVDLQDENKALKEENESLKAENKELRISNKKLTKKLEPNKRTRNQMRHP